MHSSPIKNGLRIVRSVALSPFWLCNKILTSSKHFRRLHYLSLKEGYVIADTQGETYLVDARDKTIGKKIYECGTFDFDKVVKAMMIAGLEDGNRLFVDVGANIGSICIPVVNRGLASSAIAIEPEPHNFKMLRVNVTLNDLEGKFELCNCAVSDTDRDLLIELSADNFGDHRVLSGKPSDRYGEGRRGTISVRSTTLDAVLKGKHQNNIFIWMDTQGYEGTILKGSPETMLHAHPMVIEFWPYGMDRLHTYDTLMDALVSSGYRQCYDLNLDEPAALSISTESLGSLYKKYQIEGGATDLLLL